MRKQRDLLRKDRQGIRLEISRVVAEKGISESDFRPLSVYDNWQQIEKNIVNTFCALTPSVQRPQWLWTHFKLDTFSMANTPLRPELYLNQLVEADETVWYLVNETVNEKDKLWFYEGKIKSILTIIDETFFSELYIVSKKYAWLLCINHHDYLIATGEGMPDKLRALKLKAESES